MKTPCTRQAETADVSFFTEVRYLRTPAPEFALCDLRTARLVSTETKIQLERGTMIRIPKSLLIAAMFILCAAFASPTPAAAASPAAFQGYGPPPGQVITCSSNDGRRHYCGIDTSRGVRLSRQISGSACIQGQTWGYDRRGVWVDRGCRAEFFAGGGMGGGRPPMQIITCSSNDGRRNYCPLNGMDRNRIFMSRQISGSACVQGQTWGVDRRGLWVDRGCRAEFQVRR